MWWSYIPAPRNESARAPVFLAASSLRCAIRRGSSSEGSICISPLKLWASGMGLKSSSMDATPMRSSIWRISTSVWGR